MPIDQLPENQIQKGQALVVKKNCMARAYTEHLMSFLRTFAKSSPRKATYAFTTTPRIRQNELRYRMVKIVAAP